MPKNKLSEISTIHELVTFARRLAAGDEDLEVNWEELVPYDYQFRVIPIPDGKKKEAKSESIERRRKAEEDGALETYPILKLINDDKIFSAHDLTLYESFYFIKKHGRSSGYLESSMLNDVLKSMNNNKPSRKKISERIPVYAIIFSNSEELGLIINKVSDDRFLFKYLQCVVRLGDDEKFSLIYKRYMISGEKDQHLERPRQIRNINSVINGDYLFPRESLTTNMMKEVIERLPVGEDTTVKMLFTIYRMIDKKSEESKAELRKQLAEKYGVNQDKYYWNNVILSLVTTEERSQSSLDAILNRICTNGNEGNNQYIDLFSSLLETAKYFVYENNKDNATEAKQILATHQKILDKLSDKRGALSEEAKELAAEIVNCIFKAERSVEQADKLEHYVSFINEKPPSLKRWVTPQSFMSLMEYNYWDKKKQQILLNPDMVPAMEQAYGGAFAGQVLAALAIRSVSTVDELEALLTQPAIIRYKKNMDFFEMIFKSISVMSKYEGSQTSDLRHTISRKLSEFFFGNDGDEISGELFKACQAIASSYRRGNDYSYVFAYERYYGGYGDFIDTLSYRCLSVKEVRDLLLHPQHPCFAIDSLFSGHIVLFPDLYVNSENPSYFVSLLEMAVIRSYHSMLEGLIQIAMSHDAFKRNERNQGVVVEKIRELLLKVTKGEIVITFASQIMLMDAVVKMRKEYEYCLHHPLDLTDALWVRVLRPIDYRIIRKSELKNNLFNELIAYCAALKPEFGRQHVLNWLVSLGVSDDQMRRGFLGRQFCDKENILTHDAMIQTGYMYISRYYNQPNAIFTFSGPDVKLSLHGIYRMIERCELNKRLKIGFGPEYEGYQGTHGIVFSPGADEFSPVITLREFNPRINFLRRENEFIINATPQTQPADRPRLPPRPGRVPAPEQRQFHQDAQNTHRSSIHSSVANSIREIKKSDKYTFDREFCIGILTDVAKAHSPLIHNRLEAGKLLTDESRARAIADLEKLSAAKRYLGYLVNESRLAPEQCAVEPITKTPIWILAAVMWQLVIDISPESNVSNDLTETDKTERMESYFNACYSNVRGGNINNDSRKDNDRPDSVLCDSGQANNLVMVLDKLHKSIKIIYDFDAYQHEIIEQIKLVAYHALVTPKEGGIDDDPVAAVRLIESYLTSMDFNNEPGPGKDKLDAIYQRIEEAIRAHLSDYLPVNGSAYSEKEVTLSQAQVNAMVDSVRELNLSYQGFVDAFPQYAVETTATTQPLQQVGLFGRVRTAAPDQEDPPTKRAKLG